MSIISNSYDNEKQTSYCKDNFAYGTWHRVYIGFGSDNSDKIECPVCLEYKKHVP